MRSWLRRLFRRDSVPIARVLDIEGVRVSKGGNSPEFDANEWLKTYFAIASLVAARAHDNKRDAFIQACAIMGLVVKGGSIWWKDGVCHMRDWEVTYEVAEEEAS